MDWRARPRNYDLDAKETQIEHTPANESHPLVMFKEVALEGKTETKSVSDPLAGGNAVDSDDDDVDPLSKFAFDSVKSPPRAAAPVQEYESDFEPWAVKREGILAKFTTNEKLSITFVSSGPSSAGLTSDKVKTRLDQLDDFEEGAVQEMQGLSFQDWQKKVEEQSNDLATAWDNEQRVKALKIVIQCAKMLSDTSVIKFYPSKFVLITDVLDKFGALVFSRLLSKATYVIPGTTQSVPLPEDFTPEQVTPVAKDTARNWFFKIASIRELIPRIYVETAILKCYRFLSSTDFEGALNRLTAMTRGIGDSIVGVYARAYIARVGMAIAPNIRSYFPIVFKDFLRVYPQNETTALKPLLEREKIDFGTYVFLFIPAIDWIVQCLSYQAEESLLVDALNVTTRCNSAPLLNAIMSSFPPKYVSARASQLIQMIGESTEDGMFRWNLIRTLGINVSLVPPPKQEQLQVLSQVWGVVMKYKDVNQYINCAETWIEYPVKHFGMREISGMIKDIIEHVKPNRAYEQYYPQLQSILTKVFTLYPGDICDILSCDKILPYFDLFHKEQYRVEISRMILQTFNRLQLQPTDNVVAMSSLLYIARSLHDSINASTLEDERRDISVLVSQFLNKVAFGRDFERTLEFFMNARGAFSYLDDVLQMLVQSVNLLIMQTLKLVKGKHSRKTSAFIRSCVSFNFITIPSVNGITDRLLLYHLSSRTALINEAFGQADAILEEAFKLLAILRAIKETSEETKDHQKWFSQYLSSLLGTLLLLPDNPEFGPVHTLKSLLTAIDEFKWTIFEAKADVYLNVISLLCAYAQPKYIISLQNVDSNDALYGCTPKFIAELNTMAEAAVVKVFECIEELKEEPIRRTELSMKLFERVAVFGDVSSEAVTKICLRLWSSATKAARKDRVVTGLKNLAGNYPQYHKFISQLA